MDNVPCKPNPYNFVGQGSREDRIKNLEEIVEIQRRRIEGVRNETVLLRFNQPGAEGLTVRCVNQYGLVEVLEAILTHLNLELVPKSENPVSVRKAK